MTEKKEKVKDEDIEKVGDALKRAAAKAREKSPPNRRTTCYL